MLAWYHVRRKSRRFALTVMPQSQGEPRRTIDPKKNPGETPGKNFPRGGKSCVGGGGAKVSCSPAEKVVGGGEDQTPGGNSGGLGYYGRHGTEKSLAVPRRSCASKKGTLTHAPT